MRRAAALALILAPALAGAAPPLLLQQPALGKHEIVFVFAGDLWTVPRAGGDARRLTTGPGQEIWPRVSPDGQWVAFTGDYDGNVDVYVMPIAGGVPRRLTYNPEVDVAEGWTPDSRAVLFHSTRDTATGQPRLFTVPVTGGSRHAPAAPSSHGRLVLPGRPLPRLRSPPAVASRVEAVPGRPDHTALDRRPRRLEHRQDPPRELERLQPHVGAGPDLLPLGPRRARGSLRLRHEGEDRGPRPGQHGVRLQVGLGGPGRASWWRSSGRSTSTTWPRARRARWRSRSRAISPRCGPVG